MDQKLWHICTIEYNAALKKGQNYAVSSNMELEAVILNKVSQKDGDKDRYRLIVLLGGA